MPSRDPFKTRLQLGMVVSVVIWCAYLAIGAWKYNDDYRKAVIILGCTFAFIALWAAAYGAGLRKVAREKLVGENRDAVGGWNFASACGFLLAAAATSAMAVAAFSDWVAPKWAFVSMFLMAVVGGIASIVGLSNPSRKSGRWLGLVGLGLLAAGFVIGFYVEK